MFIYESSTMEFEYGFQRDNLHLLTLMAKNVRKEIRKNYIFKK